MKQTPTFTRSALSLSFLLVLFDLYVADAYAIQNFVGYFGKHIVTVTLFCLAFTIDQPSVVLLCHGPSQRLRLDTHGEQK